MNWQLEEEPEELDDCVLESRVTRDLDPADAKPRRELLKTIEDTFNAFAVLVTNAHHLVSMNKPSRSEHRSVWNYFQNTKPVVEEERSFILHKGDLLTLRPGREHAWLDSAIERALRYMHCDFIEYLFSTKTSQAKRADGAVYYEASRIQTLASSILAVTIIALLVIPIYILYRLLNGGSSHKAYAIAVGVFVSFVVAFSAESSTA